MKVRDLFDAAAVGYDATRKRLVPCFDDFYASAIDALPFDSAASLSFLDLGAGTGLLSALLAVRFPNATFLLVDVAGAMLDQARQAFSAQSKRFAYLTLDYSRDFPPGPFDAVVSALSIHHLTDPDKRLLFTRAHDALVPGGMILNAEHLLGETPEIEQEWDRSWERSARALGSDDEEITRARERMTQDRCSPLSSQLQWLEDAGFADVKCNFQNERFAVYSGRKTPALLSRPG